MLLILSPFVCAQETHLRENGTGALLSRSAFAHGYRHGYEQGYHQGNVDANMARPAKTKLAQLKGLPLGYESRFGPKKSFEMGFTSGLQAGYEDGYAGRVFRAIAQLREAGSALDTRPASDDPTNLKFDKGVAAGYHAGFDRSASPPFAARDSDPQSAHCSQHTEAVSQENAGGQPYCEGYRRGYLMGRADRTFLPLGRPLLEAGK